MFKMIKQAKEMQSKMKETQKNLENKNIEVKLDGITIVANGAHEIISISLSDELLKLEKAKLEKILLNSLKETSKRVQKLIEEEAKTLTGGIDMGNIMNMLK